MQPKSKIAKLPSQLLRKSPLHWNRAITADDIEELATSIDKRGMINPITVRKKGQMYEYLAGERRYLANKSRGNKTLLCNIVTCDDVEARAISLEENLLTKKPNSTEWRNGVAELAKIERSRLPKRSDVPPYTPTGKKGRPVLEETQVIKTVAKKTGVSEKTIREVVKLEKLTPSARMQLEREKITIQQALILADMTKDDQRLQLSQMIQETKNQTQNRRTVETIAKADPSKAEREAIRAFCRMIKHCEVLAEEVDSFKKSMNDRIARVVYQENRDDLVDLHRAIAQLLKDIESAELSV